MTVFLAVFAVFRLAHMMTREEGPFSLWQRLRNLFLADNWIGRGIRCLWCVSFWLALPAAWLITPSRDLVWYWLGIAGAVVALDKATDHEP